ncbi:MAG TPA: hypothetical protein EYO90_02860 [Candidatus Latescibacteria bacterium]|nr:hypothetical protein [Candidatus Latescibacterota bacterium]
MTVGRPRSQLQRSGGEPAAGCIQDVDAMTAARNRSGRHCAVGYQYNCLEPIRQLKAWICEVRYFSTYRNPG